MFHLYITNKNYSSWSLRPWVLMRETNIAFVEKLTPLPGGSSFELFRRVSPTGRMPCLHDGDIRVWDSLAIIEYLAERHPKVWPEEPRARAFARCAAAEMHAGFAALRSSCSMSCGQRVRLREISAELQRDLARLSEVWEEGLSVFGGPFLAGTAFSAVDAFFCPVAFRIQSYGLILPGPAAAYAQRLLDRPAMQQWYTAAVAEPWREAGHEAEVAAAGEITEDLRATASDTRTQ